jgi:hypothetical protein
LRGPLREAVPTEKTAPLSIALRPWKIEVYSKEDEIISQFLSNDLDNIAKFFIVKKRAHRERIMSEQRVLFRRALSV